ncbi:hypothetical protein Enr13x_28260 [Stieleria neptunia]|uniref:DUF2934 domain-containing protein n=1 Tax=Stieleria neptunia TaxID=2527979 RepID=A0A518HQ53_9BACT|nr:hypothetical protein [Stieleria neptunia]QDV42974.1 hypothetical protein Enr13x_28260 [Stieleria neptunia]
MMPHAPSTLSENEIAQIEQHKYFLSEKAGYDVGWEHAEQDWREHFGPQASDVAEPGPATVRPKGLGGFFKRLISRAAV